MARSVKNTNSGRMSIIQQAIVDSGKTINIDAEDSQLGQEDKQKIQAIIRDMLNVIDRSLMARKHDETIKNKIKDQLIERLELEARNYSVLVQSKFWQFCNEKIDEILGFGAIQRLLNDEEVTDIMVNGPGPGNVFYEKHGTLHLAPEFYDNKEQIMNVMEMIVGPIGRRIDESSPTVDARLPDGSRFHGTIPPISLDGPQFTIRKFRAGMTIEQLVDKYNTISAEDADFLKMCILARLNIIVSGGTGSGKTSMLNVLSSFIPDDERIITIEDSAELQIHKPNLVRYESRSANIDGKGEVTIRQLVKESLRERPDRIIVGEVRDAAALDMMQAMNTGHEGSITTGHANNAIDMLKRVETMAMMAGERLPLSAVRNQIASAIDIIIHQERLNDGKRRTTEIVSVEGLKDEEFVTKTILRYDRKKDKLVKTYEVPKFLDKFEKIDFKKYGLTIPKWLYGREANV